MVAKNSLLAIFLPGLNKKSNTDEGEKPATLIYSTSEKKVKQERNSHLQPPFRNDSICDSSEPSKFSGDQEFLHIHSDT